MRWRQIGVLYVVAGLLAAVYFRSAPPPSGRAVPAGVPERRRVLSLDPEHVNEIVLAHGGRRVVARREGEGWTIAEPAGARVPSSLVDALATALVEAEEIERLAGESDLAAFGLDERATRVEVRSAGGPPDTLWLGETNPSGTAVYARRLGTPGVLLVGRTLRYYEELILEALPAPTVPAGTDVGPVG